jgi:hypothetical protein
LNQGTQKTRWRAQAARIEAAPPCRRSDETSVRQYGGQRRRNQ